MTAPELVSPRPVPIDDAEAAVSAARGALRESDLGFRTLTDAIPHMVWSTPADGLPDYYNARWYEFTGVPEGSTDGEGWCGMVHPDDQEGARAHWRQCLATGEPYGHEYRLRHRSGGYRWVLGRAMPMSDTAGSIVRWMGTCTDIHEQREQAEHNEVLSRELSHRIKNIFAVIGALIGQSARQDPDHRTFANELRNRIGALGRAHEFVRPHSERSRPQVAAESLLGVIADILSPYPAMAEGRIAITGEDLRLDDRGATPVALLIHELATNALKYGSLSTETGTVSLDIVRDDEWGAITWIERGGPPVAGEPEQSGFGTRLSEMSVVGQLAGEFERDWDREGLTARVRVPLKSLAR